jgi:uncharacterized protein (DUF1697 family)
MGRMVALLRGINVGKGRSLPMAELRPLCADLGWTDVATYIQSGNVVFTAEGRPAEMETALEQAIERRFGMKVPVVIRTARQWAAYPAKNPFPEAAHERPKALLLLVAKKVPAAGAEKALQARAADGERVGRAGDGLWIDYPDHIARSKLSPLLIDKLVESPATNYLTVMKLKEMLEA